jgi:hypothetical protein
MDIIVLITDSIQQKVRQIKSLSILAKGDQCFVVMSLGMKLSGQLWANLGPKIGLRGPQMSQIILTLTELANASSLSPFISGTVPIRLNVQLDSHPVTFRIPRLFFKNCCLHPEEPRSVWNSKNKI